MTSSGTTTFTLDLGEIIEEAYELAGLELRTGYQYRTARRSIDQLMIEWQNRGYNLWRTRAASIPLVAGQSEYDLPAEQLDIVEGLLRTDAGDPAKQADLSMNRVSVSTYAQQTNKLVQGRPLQFYVERKTGNIALHFWPVPDGTQAYTFAYYFMDRIQDSGKPASNTMDVPYRFLTCLTFGLAYMLAIKNPAVSDRAPMLKQAYEEQWLLAADSAREKSDLHITPYIGYV